jgi:hypothetical protein
LSRGSTRSTSSAPTEDSPPWTDLSELGRYIVAQLGDEHGDRNLLAHWIAHRLAEYLSDADTADDPQRQEAARRAAEALIPQLWAARSGWSWGWPPDAVKEFVDGVRAARGRPREEPRLSPPWLATLPELEALGGEERQIWLYGALLQVGATALREALDAAPSPDADTHDIASIRWQLRGHEEAEQWLVEHAEEGERPTRRADRARIFERALADIAARRAILVKRALADARRGTRRTRASGSAGHGAARTRPRRGGSGTAKASD